MPRAGLSPEAVIDAALEILDEHGQERLTLKAVADRTGVASPSLYKHVHGLPELRRLLAIRILGDTAERIGLAIIGRTGQDALDAYLTEYRIFATRHPHRHALIERATYDDPAFAAASARLTDVADAVARGFGLDGEELLHAVRTMRAAVTGFVSLERGRGYRTPTDIDASFAYLRRALAAGLRPDPVAGPRLAATPQPG
ncbi:WHG domain-containing protein [Actinocrinis puniceicyclus]|uniref:WHG domain-containing protein n=1 Tax=Actinocrinis puniceicyclus TaxID=977794 RepID=A0A8J7WVS3_9ACTN|nr:TetR/AcrR family transcriptional regulator [Actinocrinis puniceicyclus]MBS2966750.1 WHG domain-containing protein [Actinocrinis puniceicyclus]